MSASLLLWVAEIWLWAGAAVALVFLAWGIDRIDEDARGAWVFRPLLVPAILLIWPLVLWRWWVLENGRDDWRLRHAPPRALHALAAIAMAAAIAAVLSLGYANRQVWPAEIAPVFLGAAETGQ